MQLLNLMAHVMGTVHRARLVSSGVAGAVAAGRHSDGGADPSRSSPLASIMASATPFCTTRTAPAAPFLLQGPDDGGMVHQLLTGRSKPWCLTRGCCEQGSWCTTSAAPPLCAERTLPRSLRGEPLGRRRE